MVRTGHLPFDFADYLYSLTGANWEVRELSGGNANFVVRATQARSTLNESPVAPPYFAKFPDVQFSQKRQVVEARALYLFKADPQLSNVLESNTRVIRIPSLLHHDEAQHVLVQSDLGSHPSLDAYLSSPTTTAYSAALAGHSLGRFLANLNHAYDSVPDALSPPSNIAAALANDDAEAVMQGVIANATRFIKEAGVHDWETLGVRALGHWKSRKRTTFCQGDIWFGTITVDDTAPNRVNEGGRSLVLKICDWEFAGPNHPAADIAQLGTLLWIHCSAYLSDAPLAIRRIFTSVIPIKVTYGAAAAKAGRLRRGVLRVLLPAF
ncbi:hypothetical protein EWM64_g723 [Hericium alpestre]|uniref:Aminoglycoside phosphotransferase domain-containing protein n=1 Tax=Hericium alpestre TaxID=135208 RepID=A0A4Z0AAD3_9AGAM|nr:hypothetical protein EWM64_g723 [Hericium alpestre]